MEPCKLHRVSREGGAQFPGRLLSFAECKQHTYNRHLALFLRGEIAKEKGSLRAGYVEINLSPPTTPPALAHGSAAQREPRRMTLRMWKREGELLCTDAAWRHRKSIVGEWL